MSCTGISTQFGEALSTNKKWGKFHHETKKGQRLNNYGKEWMTGELLFEEEKFWEEHLTPLTRSYGHPNINQIDSKSILLWNDDFYRFKEPKNPQTIMSCFIQRLYCGDFSLNETLMPPSLPMVQTIRHYTRRIMPSPSVNWGHWKWLQLT